MKFGELTEEEFRTYLNESALKTFLQTPEIGKLRKKGGWEVVYLGVKENEKVIAATMLVSQKNFFNSYEFYASRGPLLDFQNEELVSFFFEELLRYTKSKNGYILRIDPYLIYHERDIDGNVVENGVNHESVVSLLKKIGFKRREHPEQVRYMFSIDLGKTEEELMKSFRSNVRNYIRKTEKMGITVKELTKEELPSLKKITEETGKRKGFVDKPLTYYEDMYDLYHDRGEIRYLLATIHLEEYLNNLNEELKEYENTLANTEDIHS
ncbi:MAG: peptidoglycan bridge formation glycyltransferase FemA/FemB family protein, partial [Firmicutes bacterium]|nr:peptidoglycan bridge formation glycyltransferase FemA/FemB family protein [Bacillota bacterium]